METKIFKDDEVQNIKMTSIAKKYECSRQYVRKVLLGEVARNSSLTRKIMTDATDMIEILERDTKVTL